MILVLLKCEINSNIPIGGTGMLKVFLCHIILGSHFSALIHNYLIKMVENRRLLALD